MALQSSAPREQTRGGGNKCNSARLLRQPVSVPFDKTNPKSNCKFATKARANREQTCLRRNKKRCLFGYEADFETLQTFNECAHADTLMHRS